MTTFDTPDEGPPAKKRITPTPLNDPKVRKRTRPLKPGRWHPRIAESTPTTTVSMGQPRPDVDEPLTIAAAATFTIYKGLPLGDYPLLLNSAYPLNRSHSKTIVVGLHAESWQPALRVCSVRAHIDLDANEALQLAERCSF